MDLSKRRDVVFLVMAGLFVTNAIVAELIGGKIINFFGVFTQSVGIILWPFVFVMTDLINEHYGRKGVKRLTYITVGLIAYTFLLLTAAIHIPAIEGSPVSDNAFSQVFGQSQWIIVGSIIAFFISQLTDVYVFWIFRNLTNGKMIWLRATGSTLISQIIDTFLVQYIAFVLPGNWTTAQWLERAAAGYVFKMLVAVALIPLIYLGHKLIAHFLKDHTERITDDSHLI